MRIAVAAALAACVSCLGMAAASFAQERPMFDFSTNPNTPDAFEWSVRARYPVDVIFADADTRFQDLRRAGMTGMRCSVSLVRTCSNPARSNTCTDVDEGMHCFREIRANGCTYRFVVDVVGVGTVTVRGHRESDCSAR